MTPQQNTKIERLTEAFESLAISVAQGILSAERADVLSQRKTSETIAKDRTDARNEFRSALSDFLAPSLRVVERVEDVAAAKDELGSVKTSG